MLHASTLAHSCQQFKALSYAGIFSFLTLCILFIPNCGEVTLEEFLQRQSLCVLSGVGVQKTSPGLEW